MSRTERLRRARAGIHGIAAYIGRGVTSSGAERDDLLLQAKTVVAAMVAWMLAHRFLAPTVTTFAPFTAIVALQATLYRSVRECVRYLGAMLLGATLAAVLAAAAGIHAWSFGLLTLAAVAAGRVRHRGSEGLQVAVVAFFAFSAFSAGHGRMVYIGHLTGSVTLGALCGLAAHTILAPARHVHHRQQAVDGLYLRMRDVFTDLAHAVEDGTTPSSEHVGRWRRDCEDLVTEAQGVQAAIGEEWENNRLHPRSDRLAAKEALGRARSAGRAAGRGLVHLCSTMRSLSHAVDGGDFDRLPDDFLAGYATLLRTLATALERIGQTSGTDSAAVDAALEEGRGLHRALEDSIEGTPAVPAPVHTLRGTLLTDASRLLHELRQSLPEPARA